MNRSRVVLAAVWVLSGCFTAAQEAPKGGQQQQQVGPDAGPGPAPREEVPVSVAPPMPREAQPAPACSALGDACDEAGCCAGLYCFSFTYAPATCHQRLADGEPCFDPAQCSSGACTADHCGTAACAANGDACGATAACCAGSYCFDFTYAPATCRPKRIDGSACDLATECQSGACTSGRCGAAACSTDGNVCGEDSECCAGSFCFSATYAPQVCTAPMVGGAYCWEDRHCATGSCVDGQCAP